MTRTLKAHIYARYGVTYDAKTQKLLTPDGRWTRPLLKSGNSKTGERVYTFSLPAGTDGTCIYDCPGCYAKTGRFTTATVKNALTLNRQMIEHFPEWTERAITAQIIADNIRDIRIHAAGDFHTANMPEYCRLWQDVVHAFPDVRFWTYTKIRECESLFAGAQNANVVTSILPNGTLNYGTCRDVLDRYAALQAAGENVRICPCGLRDRHCQDCAGCSRPGYVLFLLHSVDYYDVKQDPARQDVEKVLAAQDAARALE